MTAPMMAGRAGVRMVQSFLLLVLLQLAGEMLAAWLRLPVPGMVIGLALLLALLALRGWRLGRAHAVPDSLGTLAQGLHANFGLLFVPAGVGIIGHAELLAAEGPAVLAAVLLSTFLAIALGAAIAAWRPTATRTLAEQRP